MSHTTTTATLAITLASFLVVSGIGAPTPGEAGAKAGTPTQTSIPIAAPARQDSTRLTTTAAAPVTEIRDPIIHTENEGQRERAIWALGRFEEAGLELPSLTIHLHSDQAECGGGNGYLTDLPGGEFLIHSCGNEFTLLHELAHAWDMHALDDDTRDSFLVDAQATTWRNDENWYLAGGEHAANTIAWGLLEERINQTRTRPYDTNSMLKGFEILTAGGEPLWLDG
jgi:hypothetical protein